MQVSVDLGFRSLALAILLVVVSVVVRVKWQRYVARKVEIKRLLVLASEETARAEQETTLSYYSSLDTLVSTARISPPKPLFPSSSPPVSRTGYQCAVCFRPTTTRCARCKSVRYCSGKCQIIHWRHGHKEDCRPFTLSPYVDKDGDGPQSLSSPIHKKASAERYDNVSADATSIGSESFHSISSCDPSHTSFDNVKDGGVTGEELKHSPSETSGDSFSGFSTSPRSIGSSDSISVAEHVNLIKIKLSDSRCPSTDLSEVHGYGSRNEESSSNQFANRGDVVDSCKIPTSSHHGKNACSNAQTERNTSLSARRFSSCENSPSNEKESINLGVDKIREAKSASIFQFSTPDPDDYIVGKSTTAKLITSRTVDGSIEIDETQMPRKSLGSSADFMKKTRTVCENRDMVSNSEQSDLMSASDRKGEPMMPSNARLLPDQGESFSVAKSKTFSSSATMDNSNTIKVEGLPTARSPCLSSVQMTEKPHPDVQSSIAKAATATSQSSVRGLKVSMGKVAEQTRELSKSGKYEMGQFSYDLFVKLYITKKLELQPFGLVNCGNSCYANAILQCLAFTPPLTGFFSQGLHSKTCVFNEWCFSCEFENLILKAKGGISPLSPIAIVSHLQRIGSNLNRGCEEDAHEFLRCAIDTMQSICRKEGEANLTNPSGGDTTLIDLTFGGYLHSKIRCLKCHSKSDRQERMMDLAVEIEGDVEKLEDAIRRFTRSEILDGENKYYCGRCKTKEMAKKKLTILEAPNVLTIALKRFQAGKFGKLNKSVSFPEFLDLAPYMSGTCDKSPIYRLYAVIVHLDVMKSAFSGHYICYVKNTENKWFKVDDSSVTSVDPGRVLTSEAYMLLYSRCSPRAPRFVRGTPANKVSLPGTNSKCSKGMPPLEPTRSDTASPPPSSQANMSCYESFYLKFHRLQKIIEEDSSSDSLSFSSSNSDEGSSSTESTKDSVCTDDHIDQMCGILRKVSSSSTFDSETSSSSSSPLYTRDPSGHSPIPGGECDMDRSENKSRGSVVSGKTLAASFLTSDSVRLSSNIVGKSSSRKPETYDNVKLISSLWRTASDGQV